MCRILYLCFRPNVSQIESKDVRVHSSRLSLIAKDADTATLAKLVALVVQVLDARQMIDKRVALVGADETRRKDDAVKWHIVFGHELIVLNVVGLLEPFAPLVAIVGRYGQVADGRVEPDVEDFVGEAVERHRRAPFEVAGDAAAFEALLNPGFRYNSRRVCPVARVDRLVYPLFQSRRYLTQM